MARRVSMPVSTMFLVLIVVVVGIFLFSFFTTEGAEGTELKIPTGEEAESAGLLIFQIVIVGTATFAGYAAVTKFSGGALSRRDAFTIILIGLAAWWLWENMLKGIFNAESLRDISFTVAKKMGFL